MDMSWELFFLRLLLEMIPLSILVLDELTEYMPEAYIR